MNISLHMDPILNPYAPGAGTPPPELAGRDALRAQVATSIARVKIGRPAKSVLMVGLRGVGKTVLLDQMRKEAEKTGALTIRLEVPEGRSLPALLAPQLRVVLHKLNRFEAAKDLAMQGLRALTGFATSLKMKYQDIEVGLDVEGEAGLADNGDLEGDLATLFEQVGLAAKAAETVVVLFVDELQYIAEEQFAALISALHRCAQLQLPLTLVGAGLPQLLGIAGDAKSYAERLFDFPFIGPLDDEAASDAIVKPAQSEGVDYQHEAVKTILKATEGYPYFLQEWGKHAWDVATVSPITGDDVVQATAETLAALDESFFRVRFDRLTPKEKEYLRAMAELGPGPHRSGDIAQTLGRKVSALAPVRQSLITKGMIWSQAHGETAFTVPLFDAFMKRIMPGDDWKA
ncbi:ATP-binding protein [Chitinimonas sp. BJB300]|uniref:ATP-binding protein n=1 Tax=Chitinimonas sp. BJB300 TaxID=1559339 RepID=UPI001E53DFE3|nr:ATP-binding protein [Chitinimonas sp. BJB300]